VIETLFYQASPFSSIQVAMPRAPRTLSAMYPTAMAEERRVLDIPLPAGLLVAVKAPPVLQFPPGLEPLGSQADEQIDINAPSFAHILALIAEDLDERTLSIAEDAFEPAYLAFGDGMEVELNLNAAPPSPQLQPWNNFGYGGMDVELNAQFTEYQGWSYSDSAFSPEWPCTPDRNAAAVFNKAGFEWPEAVGLRRVQVDVPQMPRGHFDKPIVKQARDKCGLAQQPCCWHESAKSVGVVSQDGHVFTKSCGEERFRLGREGMTQRLSSICMVFDSTLRCGGTYCYNYQILDGEVGPADGAGFVFDSKVRRNNIQRMRSVFLNQRGQICLRNQEHIRKLEVQLPPLKVGMWLRLSVDLDSLAFHFMVGDENGEVCGAADVWLEQLMPGTWNKQLLRSGFFCAVVTKDIAVSLS